MSTAQNNTIDDTAPPAVPLTALGICNLALSKLGESPLEAIDANGSPASRMCYMHYHPVRREVLMAHRWSFATRLAQLDCSDEGVDGSGAASQADPETSGESSSGTSDSVNPPPGALLPHSLPQDCLRVLEVNRHNWVLRGRAIFCPGQRVRLLYIADVEDPALFDPLFAEALASKLAIRLCIPLTSSTTARKALTEEYQRMVLPEAAHFNAVQSFSNDTHPLYRFWRDSHRGVEW